MAMRRSAMTAFAQISDSIFKQLTVIASQRVARMRAR
jgi:hypothetical protein